VGADVYDGETLVGPAPAVVKVPRGGEPHTIVVKKDGYLTSQRVVAGKEDSTLKLRLSPKPVEEKEEPLPPAPPPKPVVQVAPPTVTPPKPAPPKPAPPKPETVAAPSPAPKKHHPKLKKEDTLILTPSF
jgi:hypothetical protein